MYTSPWRQTPPPWNQIPSLEADNPPETATAADGTHPTGMHSCYNVTMGLISEQILCLNRELNLSLSLSRTASQLQDHLSNCGRVVSASRLPNRRSVVQIRHPTWCFFTQLFKNWLTPMLSIYTGRDVTAEVYLRDTYMTYTSDKVRISQNPFWLWTQRRRHQKSETGVSLAPKMDMCPTKFNNTSSKKTASSGYYFW